jgi:hypothetical protein
VTDFEEQNQMNADNLATCLAQSLVFPPGGTGGIFPINLGEHNNLVKSLIIQVGLSLFSGAITWD